MDCLPLEVAQGCKVMNALPVFAPGVNERTSVMYRNVKSKNLMTVLLALLGVLAGCGTKANKDTIVAAVSAAELAGDSQL